MPAARHRLVPGKSIQCLTENILRSEKKTDGKILEKVRKPESPEELPEARNAQEADPEKLQDQNEKEADYAGCGLGAHAALLVLKKSSIPLRCFTLWRDKVTVKSLT